MKNKVIASCFKWGHRHNRQLITLLLLSVMFVSLSYKGYEAYTTAATATKDSPQNNLQSKDNTRQQLKPNDFQLLFGSSERPEAQPKTADIPKTRLNLTLHGALSGLLEQPGSSAIIEGGNQDKLYQVGDSLPGGATLSEVHSDHVVLMRNGQLEILPFPDAAKESKGINAYHAPSHKPQSDTKPRDDYTKQPDGDSLEERMRKLREQLQQANQGSP